jgi:3-dehydroquinate synthase
LSARVGLVDAAFVERIERLCVRAGLPVRAPALGAERYLQLMRGDKKSEAGEIRFVLVDQTGDGSGSGSADRKGRAVMRAAPDHLVREVIATYCIEASA